MKTLDEMLSLRLLSHEQHQAIADFIAQARTPEAILQMPEPLWRALSLASVLMNLDAEGASRRRVAVVGAGLAGLVAARRLADAGCEVTVFEKSRGPGGRCAARRSDFGPFQHGVASFAAHGPAFRAELARWQDQGWAAAAGGRWRGVPTVNALARQLAQGLVIQTGTTMQALRASGRGRWQLTSAEQGELATEFDTVLLAVPAEQARPLCAASPFLRQTLNKVHSQPCWTLMLAWNAPGPGIEPPEVGPGPSQGEVLAKLWAEAPDPSHPTTRWVLHAQPGWSLANLELPAAEATASMLQALQAAVAATSDRQLPVADHAAAHRWRYAQVAQPALAACGWDAALRLGCAGDAWGGRPSDSGAVPEGVERAWLSGVALAEAALHVD